MPRKSSLRGAATLSAAQGLYVLSGYVLNVVLARFLGPGSLDERVGKRFGDGPVIVPLPHPSGQSRWLNEPANRERLAAALALVADLRARHAAPKRDESTKTLKENRKHDNAIELA